MSRITDRSELTRLVNEHIQSTPVYDLHTHLFPASFGDLCLWGIDETLTYHYLLAEVISSSGVDYEAFWAKSKTEQADFVWDELFVRNSPISEATRGVATCLDRLGIEVGDKDLNRVRAYFAEKTPEEFTDIVFDVGNIEEVGMTNDPFDPQEKACWDAGVTPDSRFRAALRLDHLLLNWDEAGATLRDWGYTVGVDLTDETLTEVRRFLNDWVDRIDPAYFAASLPPDFDYPTDTDTTRLLEDAVLQVGRERSIPFAMMVGVRRGVNEQLRMAGDGGSRADVSAVERLAAANSENKFLVTFLMRDNQHEACVMARKFPNVMLFGCWWFVNNPSLIREITLMRFELLGPTFIPQHSDARIIDQLLYKWTHSRLLIADALLDKYGKAMDAGWPITEEDVRRDTRNLLGGHFKRFIGQ